jgi:hypothetical protein
MIPLWLKVAVTLYVCVLVPVYWRQADAGPRNFLWFSDIALFGAVAALWLESSLLASTMAVGVLIPELFWNVAFIARIVTGKRITNLAEYMFESRRPRLSRALSLFHLYLPWLLLWMVARLGYDDRAFLAMTAISIVVLPITYAITQPEHNINWVHGWSGRIPAGLSPRQYLALVMIAFPALIYAPTHALLRALF